MKWPRRVVSTLAFLALFAPHPALAQFSQQGPKLVGEYLVGAAEHGFSVAVSADGSTAIAGADADNGGTGAVCIWTRTGSFWAQQARLIAGGAVGAAHQGSAVALSADGNTAIVGGNKDNGGAGAAWIYTRTGNIWSQQGPKLVAADAIGKAEQGFSVALSADGNTALVGGWFDDSLSGAAWVWTRSGGVWTEQAKLVGTGAVGEAYRGVAVALSADGNTALVGGFSDDAGVGAAWVWTRSAGTWTQQGPKLVGSGAVGYAEQGNSVALSGDGNTAIVAGYADNSYTGTAWVWTRSNGAWTQQGAKLVGTGAVGASEQGGSVSLSYDGNTALIGANGDAGTAGAAFVWTRSDGTWRQQGAKLVGSGAAGNAEQGYSVSLSADATTAVVGGYGDNARVGAVWVFAAAATLPSAPTAMTATAASTTRVDLQWSVTPGATSYQVDRRVAGEAFVQIGTSKTNSFSDTTASASSAYLYRVRAVNGAGVSSSSTADLATTVVFTDEPLVPRLTVKAVHLSELRTAVNALRLLADLPAATFTGAATPGTVVRAVHVTELRSAIDSALSSLGFATSPYTDPILTGTTVKAVHFQELRARIR